MSTSHRDTPRPAPERADIRRHILAELDRRLGLA